MVELIVKDIVSNYFDNKSGLMLLDEIKKLLNQTKMCLHHLNRYPM